MTKPTHVPAHCACTGKPATLLFTASPCSLPSPGLRPRRGQLTPLKVPEDCPAEVAALQVRRQRLDGLQHMCMPACRLHCMPGGLQSQACYIAQTDPCNSCFAGGMCAPRPCPPPHRLRNRAAAHAAAAQPPAATTAVTAAASGVRTHHTAPYQRSRRTSTGNTRAVAAECS